MYIRATFINRTYAPDSIELVHAWDEYQIDENPEGYAETRAADLSSYGDEVQKVVTVDLLVDYPALCQMFDVQRMHVQNMTAVEQA
jgi:hypothetical protein